MALPPSRPTADVPPLSEIDRVRALDASVHAWAHLSEAPHAQPDIGSPLNGVLFGVKDVIDVEGMPTRCGSELEPNRLSARDAACVATLRAAGAIPIGKTHTAEFAYRRPPETENPAAPGHTPGGSSSGSAAAVASGMVPFALSTQTGGSIIRPAAYCGVIGFKPSFGLVSRSGLAPGCESLDTIGWHASDIEIALRVAQTTLGHAYEDSMTPASLKRLKFLFINEPGEELPSPEVSDNLARVRFLLHEHGATTQAQTGAQSTALDEYLRAHKVVMVHELARSLRPIVARHAYVSEPIRELLAQSKATCFTEYMDALAFQTHVRGAWNEFANGADVIVAPSAPTTAPAGFANSGSSAYCRAWTFLGWPCLHLPVGVSTTGLPIGVQIVMPWGADFELLVLANLIWRLHARHPSNSIHHC